MLINVAAVTFTEITAAHKLSKEMMSRRQREGEFSVVVWPMGYLN